MLRGSSPLARGLHLKETQNTDLRRIIPARAGFTLRPGVAHVTLIDQPRSRGVYYSKVTVGTDYSWIIPARAGFTQAHVEHCVPP